MKNENLIKVYDAIESIADDSSLNNKEILIKKYSKEVEYFNEVVQYTYDYLKVYNIKKFLNIDTINIFKNRKTFNSISEIFKFLDALSSKSGATNEDIYKLMELASLDSEDKTVEVIRRIVNKDLRCGAGNKLFNKYIPLNLYDGVCLCSDDYTRFLKKECNGSFKNALWSEKLDGCRATTKYNNKNNTILSRNGKPLSNFIAPLNDELNIFFNKLYEKTNQYYSLDGEMIFVNQNNKKTFQKLMKTISALKPEALNMIEYRIFDIIIDNKTLIERYNLLKSIFDENNFKRLKLVEHYECEKYFTNIEELEKFTSEKSMKYDWEGLVLKIKNSKYEFKRSKNWVKVKLFKSEDCPTIGFEYGEPGKKYENVLGKLICHLPNKPDKVFGCGSGFTDEQRKEFLTNIPSKIELKFFELSEDGIPRFPIFIRVVDEDN